MLQLEEQSLEMRTPQATKTAVLVIGGAEDKVHGREILQTFFSRWLYGCSHSDYSLSLPRTSNDWRSVS